ncbi:MAG: NADH:flavin oxidoreductase/NADH oxidase [Pseudomonadota bacterium]
MSALFTPLDLGGLTLKNRIIVAPMCQYCATDGRMNEWHQAHLSSLAISGAGLLIVEATAASPEGRITPGCTGLYDNANEAAMGGVIAAVRKLSKTPIALQIGHAGRKASSETPFDGGAQILSSDPRGWVAEAPSSLPHIDGEEAPLALDEAGLARVCDRYVDSALRAARIGFDGIELHMAHGYLLHQFLSPLSNKRSDTYGGSIENRMRFPLEVLEAVRNAAPDLPVWVRLSAVDWVEGGLEVEDAVTISRALEQAGAAAIHVSSAGVSPYQKIPVGPGYQVHLAEAVKQAVGVPVIAVGLITEPRQAEDIIASEQADAVALARGMLWDPRWPWRAAVELGAEVEGPQQYWRSAPHGVTPPFVGFTTGQR